MASRTVYQTHVKQKTTEDEAGISFESVWPGGKTKLPGVERQVEIAITSGGQN
jgi:hypothetical protein